MSARSTPPQILPFARPSSSRGWTTPTGTGTAQILRFVPPEPKPTEKDDFERVARVMELGEKRAEGCRLWHETHRRVAFTTETADALWRLSQQLKTTEGGALTRLLSLGWALETGRHGASTISPLVPPTTQ